MNTYYFPSGPKILISVFSKDKQLKFTTVQEAIQFSLTFSGEIEEETKATLIRWCICYSQRKQPQSLIYLIENKLENEFKAKVVRALDNIPIGATASYQDIASIAGNKKACRAVGNICRVNIFPIFIPCHRVISKNKTVGGYAFGSELKQHLLEYERVLS